MKINEELRIRCLLECRVQYLRSRILQVLCKSIFGVDLKAAFLHAVKRAKCTATRLVLLRSSHRNLSCDHSNGGRFALTWRTHTHVTSPKKDCAW